MTLPANALPSIPGHYSSAVAITPQDAVFFDTCKALYIGNGGQVTFQTADNNGVFLITPVSVPSGTIIYGRIIGVAATITTATGIIALY